MTTILNIETTGAVCSVSLTRDGEEIELREDHEPMSHASRLGVLIEEILNKIGDGVKKLDAVAVSMGPGSYTGLRIGVSTAKGICYGAGIPLIAMETLYLMTTGFLLENEVNINYTLLCPMIDARRMEVYTRLFDSNGKALPGSEISAMIIDKDSFGEELVKNEIFFFGSGAKKCQDVIQSTNGRFYRGNYLSARNMGKASYTKFLQGEFVDTAYFEPFYLKEFVATTPKNKVLKNDK